MADDNEALKHVHAALGYEHVSRAWARLEIFFGLAASGLGMLVGLWAVSHPAMQLGWAGAGLLLFIDQALFLRGEWTHIAPRPPRVGVRRLSASTNPVRVMVTPPDGHRRSRPCRSLAAFPGHRADKPAFRPRCALPATIPTRRRRSAPT